MERRTLCVPGRAKLGARCWLGRAALWLVVGVVAWWLVVFATVAFVMPVPAGAGIPAPEITPGRWAYIYAPVLQAWLIPTDRETYEDYRRALLADDAEAVTGVIARPGWFLVADRDAVRVLAVDGDAVRVQSLEGPSAGRQSWVEVRRLHPASSW